MIQDIYPHKLHNEFLPDVTPSKDDIVLNFFGGKILINIKKFDENILEFPKVEMLENIIDNSIESLIGDETLTFLFKIDDTNYFLYVQALENENALKDFGYVEERGLRKVGIAPEKDLFAAITGKHLSDWYRDTKFCGRCGNKMVHSKKERAMTCEACGYTSYPRIMPAVIVGVKNEDRLLITRYRIGYAHNALVAGFTEIGETVEETVAREVMEEAGLKVKNIKYYKSQPWGSANDILLGYYCDVDGDDTINMDSEELKYAEWVKREDIVLQPGSFSLTNEMMEMFKNGMEI